MGRYDRTIGILLSVVGFVLAVPLVYLTIRLDYQSFINILKILFIILLFIIGSLLSATGIILALGWPKSSEEAQDLS
ncbi:MAG: hypothetical protein F7C38_04265 [Desulfurococcales archaeon]|nr:hypothetical protein [Desulfurococcales archaeon]